MHTETHPDKSKSKHEGAFCRIVLPLILVLLFPSSLWAQDNTFPTVSFATVDEPILAANFNEDIASVTEKTVTPTLSSALITSDMEKVSYTAPTEPSAELRDVASSDAVDFTDPKVFSICSRTQVVRDVILEQLPNRMFCGPVSADDLSSITFLNFLQRDVTTLANGDFAGLTNLTGILLTGNALTSLPEDLFDGLTNLSELYLNQNDLTSLNSNLFDGLTNLEILHLGNNGRLTTLHQDLFDGLTSLKNLDIGGNGLTTLHQDLFDDLTSLEELDIDHNELTSLNSNLFDGPTSLKELRLADNKISSLNSNLFDGLTSLEFLSLSGNDITFLSQNLFEELTSLRTLFIRSNSLVDPPQDLFDGLTNLETLNFENNSFTNPPRDLFDGLTNLQTLNLDNNSITELHPELFNDVESDPFTVSLNGNPLTCVPAAILNQGNVVIEPTSIAVVCPDLLVTLSTNPISIGEEDGATEIAVTATLNVLRSTPTPVTVSVGSGTATSGTDFTEVSDFTISIPANTRSATGTFTLTPTSDTVEESNETVRITGTSTASNVTGVIATSLAINDDDITLTVSLDLSLTSISENAGSTTVTATLNSPSTVETTITISADPTSPATESDYTLSGSTLTIAAGQTESTGNVTITAVDNPVDAPDRTVQVQGTTENTQGVTGPSTVELTITDDEGAPTVTLSLEPSTITEDGGSTTVTAMLNHPSIAATTVTVTALANPPAVASDLVLSQNTTLTIEAGDTESTGLVTMTAVDNEVGAPDKTVQVQGAATNTQGVTAPADVVLTITDDGDINPTVSLTLTSTSISEDEGQTTVTATIDPPSSAVTTIEVSVLPDVPATESDYQVSENPTLTIAAGETESTGLVTITAVDNEVDAPDKTVQVQGNATNAQEVVTNPEAVELTITDDEEAPTVTLMLDPPTISENGGETTVTASLNRASGTVTTIEVMVLPDAPATESDYQISDNVTLTIAAGETESTGLVTMTAVDNEVQAPDKTVQVQGTATNTQNVTGPEAVELTITDDETPPTVTLMLSLSTIEENEDETTVTASLNRASGTVTTIEVMVLPDAPATESDYQISENSTLTIAAGETASTGTVTITAVDNEVDAPDKTVQVQGTATNTQDVMGPEDVELTITDDEEAPTVTLMLVPSTIEENEGETTVTATLTHPSSAVTTIVVTALPDAPATESDYQISENSTLTIAAGETESTESVTITAVDNEVDMPDKTVQVQGAATNTQGVTAPADVVLTITDDDTSTAAEAPTELPTVFTLHGNYPNPFNPSTRIQFDLPERAQVTVQVLDVLGRKVMEYPAQAFDAGANQTIELNAIQLGSGTYLYRMIAVGSETKYQKTGRMILMK